MFELGRSVLEFIREVWERESAMSDMREPIVQYKRATVINESEYILKMKHVVDCARDFVNAEPRDKLDYRAKAIRLDEAVQVHDDFQAKRAPNLS